MPLLFTSLLSTGSLPAPPAPAPWEIDPTRVPPDYVLADGNRKATYEGTSTDNATWVVTVNAIQPGAGKRYWEVLCAAGNAQYNGYIGVVPSGQREDYNVGKHPVYFNSIAYRGNGTIWSSGNSTAYQAVTGLATYGQNAVLMFVFDPATAGLWVGKDGVWSHDPVSGAASWSSAPGAAFYPVIEGRASQEGGTLRSLASQFSYPAPAGTLPLAE